METDVVMQFDLKKKNVFVLIIQVWNNASMSKQKIIMPTKSDIIYCLLIALFL